MKKFCLMNAGSLLFILFNFLGVHCLSQTPQNAPKDWLMMAVCKPFDIVSITNYLALSDVYSMNFTVLISSVAISTYFLIVKYFLKHIIVVTNYPFNLIQKKNKHCEVQCFSCSTQNISATELRG